MIKSELKVFRNLRDQRNTNLILMMKKKGNNKLKKDLDELD